MKLFSATFETLKYAVPMVGARVIGNAMGFIGMLMIAHLGHKQLAAGALVSSTSMTLLVIFWSFLFAAGVIIAPYFARKEHEEIGEIVRQIWLLGLLLAIPLCIIFLSVGPALLWMGQEKALVVLVSQYFHVLVWAVPPSFIFIGSMQFMTAVGKPKIVAYITMIEFIIMLPLGYGLVFGKLGLPNLGMVGMAYANVVTYWIGMIASLLWIRFYKHFQAFNIFKFKKPANYRHLKKQWQLSVPICLQFIAELSAFSFTTIMIGWLGESSLAAQQIVLQLGYVVVMVPYGIAQAGAILIAHALGKEDVQAVKGYGQATYLLGTTFIIIVAVIYITAPKFIISAFGVDIHNPKNIATVHIATTLLFIVAFSQILDAIRNIATGALRAFHDTKFPMIVGFIASWGISIPVGYALAFWLGLGAAGVRSGYLFGWFFGAFILLYRFYKKVKQVGKTGTLAKTVVS